MSNDELLKKSKLRGTPKADLQPICEVSPQLRESQRSITTNVGRSGQCGLDPEQAIQQWLEFAKRAGHLRVTGQRRFSSPLELVETMDAEATSFFAFARSVPLSFSEVIDEVIHRHLPMREGNEHKVYRATIHGQNRVVKITHAGKYGRNEHTPFQYLLRWKLLNDFAPSIDARIEDCIANNRTEISIITSMNFFQGSHPSPAEADEFVRSLGFDLLRDGSSTQDYINPAENLILRDCHPGNWIKTEDTLVPIDIIPEIVSQSRS